LFCSTGSIAGLAAGIARTAPRLRAGVTLGPTAAPLELWASTLLAASSTIQAKSNPVAVVGPGATLMNAVTHLLISRKGANARRFPG
jgi:hypothetical protein